MATVLITGANRGLGLELARQYAADGWRVHATCREPGRADALAAVAGDIAVHRLDVTDPGSIRSLAAELAGAPIDLLINNAGVSGPRGIGFGEIDYQAWLHVLDVNVLGVFRVSEAFRENVGASEQRKIVALTSRMGSIGDNSAGGSYLYRSSKAALNAAMKSLALDLAGRGIRVCVFHPGWVRTDMGGQSAKLAIPESVTALRGLFARVDDRMSGRFLNYDGSEIPW